VLTFCFFLFNDKKMARPAGHDHLAACAKKTLGASRKEKVKGRDAQGHVPYKVASNTLNREKAKNRVARYGNPYERQGYKITLSTNKTERLQFK